MKIVKSVINFTTDILETIVFIGSIYIVVYLYLFFPTSVIGASMEPTLHTNDRLIVSKISYKLEAIKRGDIVVLHSPKNSDIEYIKRVIGIAGDEILIKDQGVFINGVKLDESYVSVKTNVWEYGFSRENVPYTVPKDYVFVMGDNRPRSSDSREFGSIPISSVVGKAVLRYYPQFSSLNK